MIDLLMGAMAYRAAGVMQGIGQPRWGVVTNVDPANMAVRVRFEPDGTLSGWMPILAMAAGSGWSVATLPTPGMQAFVLFDTGDALNGVVVGFAHSTSALPPQVPAVAGTGGVPNATNAPLRAGETIMTGPGGQVLRIGPDGIYMRGTVTIDGNVRVNGDVSDKTGSLDRLRTNFNSHIHTGPGSGPLPQDT